MPELVTTERREPPDLVDISVLTHPGRVRKDNQDRVGRAARRGAQIAVVADGVGGEAGGAIAAELAVQGYLALLAAQSGSAPHEMPADALQRATQGIQQEIAEAREANSSVRSMASTVVVLYLQDAVATVGHLGDARAYLFRAGQLQRLTQDHSLVDRMVRDGLLTEAEALHHPQGHILTHSLGQPQMLLEITAVPVMEGDIFLLCSDGLWACVQEAALASELAGAGPKLATATQRLLECALEAGAPDNVSVALVRVCSPEAGVAVSDATAQSPRSPGTPALSLRTYVLPALALLALACALIWGYLHYAVR